MPAWFHPLIAGAALLVAAWFRPWLSLSRKEIQHPWLAALVILPWAWAAHASLPGHVVIHLSGACLLVLMLGWPLAVWTLALIAALTAGLTQLMHEPQTALGPLLSASLGMLVWSGIVPATAALGLGVLSRRWLPAHLFVYILVRAFIVTALAMMLAAVLEILALGHASQMGLSELLVGRWLMAWAEGVATGMLVAIFVAYKPLWLITYSDARYLPRD